MKSKKNFGGRKLFKNPLAVDWIEFLIEFGAIAVGFAILLLFPGGVFEDHPDLAILIGALVIVGIIGLVALVIHLINRKRTK